MASPGMTRDANTKPESGAALDVSHGLAQGLALCLPLNEAGSKQVGDACNGYVGTLNGGVTWGANGRGEALVLDGSSGYVDLSAYKALIPSTVATAEIWIKASSPGASYRRLVALNNAWGCYLKDSVLMAYDFGGNADRSSGVNLADGIWHHVVYVFRGGVTNGCQFWVDGALVYTFSASVGGASPDFSFGGSAGQTQFVAAAMEKGSIWNRALSPGEITTLYNHPYGMFLPSNTRRFYQAVSGLSKALTDSLTFTDARLAGLKKAVLETLALSDGRTSSAAKSVAETLGLTDTRSLGAARKLAETLALSDAGVSALLNAGGQAFSRSLTETLSLSDARLLQIGKKLAESLALTDVRALNQMKKMVETLGLSDQFNSVLGGAAAYFYVQVLASGGLYNDITGSGQS